MNLTKSQALLVYIVLLGTGFLCGWWLSYRLQEPAKTAKQPDDPWQNMPSWEEWKYPDSKLDGSSISGGVLSNKVQVGPTSVVVMLTPDDFEKVLSYYAVKCEAKIIASPSGTGGIGNVGNNKAVDGQVIADVFRSRDDGGPGRERPVKTKMIARRTSEYDLTLVVSKSEGEKLTHIMLAYYPSP